MRNEYKEVVNHCSEKEINHSYLPHGKQIPPAGLWPTRFRPVTGKINKQIKTFAGLASYSNGCRLKK